MVRNHNFGISLTKNENEQLNEFVRDHKISNKSELGRWLLHILGVIKIQDEHIGVKCSICNRVLNKQCFLNLDDGSVICDCCKIYYPNIKEFIENIKFSHIENEPRYSREPCPKCGSKVKEYTDINVCKILLECTNCNHKKIFPYKYHDQDLKAWFE